jgi:hypothetical protein
MRLAGRIACMEMKIAYTVFVLNLEGNIPLGRSGRRWKYIRMGGSGLYISSSR